MKKLGNDIYVGENKFPTIILSENKEYFFKIEGDIVLCGENRSFKMPNTNVKMIRVFTSPENFPDRSFQYRLKNDFINKNKVIILDESSAKKQEEKTKNYKTSKNVKKMNEDVRREIKIRDELKAMDTDKKNVVYKEEIIEKEDVKTNTNEEVKIDESIENNRIPLNKLFNMIMNRE